MTESVIPDPEEHLTSGWEPDLPAEDTLVRRAVLAQADWPVTVARALGRPYARTDTWAGASIADRGALSNPVVLLQPRADRVSLVSEVAEVVPPGVPYVVLDPFSGPDLSEHGLVLLGHPPLMARLPAPHTIAPRAGVELREVTEPDALAVAERVLVQGYPMPELEPLSPGDLFAPAILDGASRFFVAFVDGEPGAVAVSHVAHGAVLVEYVAALKRARGRGAAATATWAATLADPDLPAVLLASDEGRPVYERMGYVAIERWTAWLRPASA